MQKDQKALEIFFLLKGEVQNTLNCRVYDRGNIIG